MVKHKQCDRKAAKPQNSAEELKKPKQENKMFSYEKRR